MAALEEALALVCQGLVVFCPANHGVPARHFTLAKVLLRDKHAQTGYCAVPLATRPRLLPLPPLGVLLRCSTLRGRCMGA